MFLRICIAIFFYSNREFFKNKNKSRAESYFEPPPPPLGRNDLAKNPKKEEDGKIAEGQGDAKKGRILQQSGGCYQSGYFSSWGVANVTVTFNYILVIEFLFPLNVDVIPCFHCTVLVPVYMVYTSCFHNTVVSSSCIVHTSNFRHASVIH